MLLWLNRRGWYQYPNPFGPLIERQFGERQKFWQDTSGRPSDREMILDMFLRAQKEHPEVPDFQPIAHAFGVVGGSSESMYVTGDLESSHRLTLLVQFRRAASSTISCDTQAATQSFEPKLTPSTSQKTRLYLIPSPTASHILKRSSTSQCDAGGLIDFRLRG